MEVIFTKSLLLLLYSAHRTYANIDYCDAELCPFQGQHVACRNNGTFSSDCTGEFFLEDMEPYIDLILDEHNMYRNRLASGSLECFYPATRMPALSWDSELSNNAKYNVKTCKFAHDLCRSTPDYPFAGQNIYYARTKNLNLTTEQFIREAIFLWFIEYLDANVAVVERFERTDPQTGHFTTLVNDRQTRVGCAFLNNLQKKRRKVIFTCNYPSSNIEGFPTYKPGPPASDCFQLNEKYDALCDDTDIDPNDFYWYNDGN